MGEELGGEWTCVYVWMSPLDVSLQLSQHDLLIGYMCSVAKLSVTS